MNIPAAELTDNLLSSLTEMETDSSTLLDTTELVVKEDSGVSNHYSPGVTSPLEEKALVLLGAGVASESVASALGVTPSRIAQLLSNKLFAGRVSELRYESLQKHNKRDNAYDTLEDLLIKKLKSALPLLIKPESILKAVSVVNNAKRRGQSAPQQVINQQNIVNLILPNIITRKFTVNIDNQVTKAGDQELLTMPSGDLLKQVEAAETARLEAPENQTQELLVGDSTDDTQEERSKS